MKVSRKVFIFIGIILLVCFISCNKINKKIYETNEKKAPIDLMEAYEVKPNVIFYVLKDEYFKNAASENPNLSQLIREFICYDGMKNNIYPYTWCVILDKVDSIEEFRDVLVLDDETSLKLPDNTIVSTKVLEIWKDQNYDGVSSYSDKSPKGLDYFQIK